MKKLLISLFLLVSFAGVAAAQTTSSLFDFNQRLSIGARAYRSFDEVPSLAGSYSSAWWAGLSFSHEITSPHDPAVKLPLAIIGAFDFGIPSGGQNATIRGYVGIGLLLKKAGQ